MIFFQKDPDDSIDKLNELVEKAHAWIGPSSTNSNNRSPQNIIYHKKEEEHLKAQLEVLISELKALKMKDIRSNHMVARVEIKSAYFICRVVEHLAQNFPFYSEMKGLQRKM